MECPNCETTIRTRVRKNLKGRPSAKSMSTPDECPECGSEIVKAETRRDPSLLNK